jgi:hypothetical protein
VHIEDILPYFPDFVVIDDFKEPILKALEEYQAHIEQLKADMDDATRSAEAIRLDMRELKRRFIKISFSAKCCLCSVPLLLRGFYAFPCRHHFHMDCLTAHMIQEFLPKQVQQKLVRLQEWLAQTQENLERQPKRSSLSMDQLNTNAALADPVALRAPRPNDGFEELLQLRSRIQEAMEELVASECIYCGELMLKTIDKPFISEDEGLLAESWSIV